MNAPSDNINNQDESNNLSEDRQMKLQCLQEIFTDKTFNECRLILESNNWSLEESVELLASEQLQESITNHRSVEDNAIQTFASNPNTDYLPIVTNHQSVSVSTTNHPFMQLSDRLPNSSASKSFTLPKHVVNEIQLSPFIERIYYQPLVSNTNERHHWLNKIVNLLFVPINITINVFNIILKLLLFRHNKERLTNGSATPEDGQRNEAELIEILSRNLQSPSQENGSVSLFLGSFESAIAQAKHDYKYLVIYLHKPADRIANDFLNNSLLHPEVLQLLNDPDNLLFWPASLSNQEGDAVSHHLLSRSLVQANNVAASHAETSHTETSHAEASSVGSSIILAFTTIVSSSGGGTPKLSVIGQLESPISPTELQTHLIKWKEVGSRPRLTAKREKDSRDAIVNLRKSQEVAFDEVLARDMMRERFQQMEQDEQSAVGERKAELRHKLTQMMEGVNATCEADAIASSGVVTSSFSSGMTGSVVNLMIRMHNGRRFQWSFHKDNSIKYLYYLIYCQEDAPHKFELLWGYPQKLLHYFPMSLHHHDVHTEGSTDDAPSFHELDLLGNQTILVRDVEA